ncbi:MAG: efflux RND transporter periplasmic adaptor subunit, partial [Bacteroidota bacterium]|nr:efflux RND transporter periplasmic adaptor subunit [Bacteroidota bacterium]
MKTNKLVKYLLIIVGALIVFALIGKKSGWFGKEITIKVSTENPQKRIITEVVTASGKIQPETEVNISPDVSGEIVELNVKEGDYVKKGSLLLKIKPDIYKSMVDRAKASLNSTKANYANSKAVYAQIKAKSKQSEQNYKRNKLLWDKKAISESEWESALYSYEMSKGELNASMKSVESAKYSVESAKATLKESEENLRKTKIYAPMSGTISRLNVELGERVVGTAQMAGTELLRIANLNRMELKVDVNENDIVRVNLKDTAIIEVDAYYGEKYKGVVTEIANSANISGVSTDQVTNFDVKILLLTNSYKQLITKTNPNPFRPGMSASADIQTNTQHGILTIPIQAVTTRVDTTNKADSLTLETEKKLEEIV